MNVNTKKSTSYRHRRRFVRENRIKRSAKFVGRVSGNATACQRLTYGVSTGQKGTKRKSLTNKCVRRVSGSRLTTTLKCGLILPKLDSSVPPVLSESADDYRVAYIANGFYEAGILRDEDWSDSITSSLQTAITRWVLSDCKTQRLSEGFGLSSFVYTDDVESQDRVSFHPRSKRPGWFRGGFFVHNGFDPRRYSLGYECSRLNQIEPNLGFEIFNLLAKIADSKLDAITPYNALAKLEEWEYEQPDEDIEDGFSDFGGYNSKRILAENPSEIFACHWEPISTSAIESLAAKAPDLYFGDDDWLWAHGMALQAGDLLRLQEAYSTLPPDPDCYATSIDAHPASPIAIVWHPEATDGLHRFGDDQYQLALEGELSSVVFTHGFWIPPIHRSDNSLSLSIKKLDIELKELSLLHAMLFELGTDKPVNLLPPRYEPVPLMELFQEGEEGDFIATI